MVTTEGTVARAPRPVEALQALVRIPTVSHPDPERVDTAAFERFGAELARRYPLVHASSTSRSPGTACSCAGPAARPSDPWC